jgi:hypothetical protein
MANQTSYASLGYETNLATSLASGATTVNVISTVGSPAVPCYLTIDPGNDAKREVVLATAKTSTTFTITRGHDGTSDVAHDPDAVIGSYPVSAHVNDLHDRVDGKATDAGVVHLAGAETITGAKTFSVDPTLADGSSALSLTEGNAAYQPLRNRVLLPASALDSIQGTPTLSSVGSASTNREAAWLFNDAGTNAIASLWVIPEGWATVNVKAVMVKPTINTGDFVLQLHHKTAGFAAGDDITTSTAGTAVTTTATTQYLVQHVTLGSGLAVTPGNLGYVNVRRSGADAADTLTGDMALVGVLIEKAS